MKKILIVLLLSFASLNLFSEEFYLFPWFCTQKDVYNQCINKDWRFQSANYNKMELYTFYTPDLDVTYCDFPIQSVSCLFDENGDMLSQAVGFHNLDEMLYVVSIVLEIMTNDKIRIIDKTIEKNEAKNYVQITYKGLKENNNNVTYAIRSTDDGIKLVVSYFAY